VIRGALENLGYDVTLHEVEEFWTRVSSDAFTSWRSLTGIDLEVEIEKGLRHLRDVLDGKDYE